jgi:hypothetical protein
MGNEDITSIFDTINNIAEKLFVEDRVSRALTDPNPMFRGWAITSLKNAYPTLVRGFVADNAFYLSFQEEGELKVLHAGEVPKQSGAYVQTHNFDTGLQTKRPSIIPRPHFDLIRPESNESPEDYVPSN